MLMLPLYRTTSDGRLREERRTLGEEQGENRTCAMKL